MGPGAPPSPRIWRAPATTRACGCAMRPWPRPSPRATRTRATWPASGCRRRSRATTDLAAAVADAALVVVVLPSEFCREVYRPLARTVAPDATLVSATKGLETRHAAAHERGGVRRSCPAGRWPCSPARPSPRRCARGQPTAVVVASARSRGGRARAARRLHALVPRLLQRRRRGGRAGGRAQERHRHRGRHRRRPRPTATTPWRRSSRAAWRRSRGSPWPAARARTRWPAWPAWATWCSPARAPSRATGAWARRWAAGCSLERGARRRRGMVAEGVRTTPAACALAARARRRDAHRHADARRPRRAARPARRSRS